MRATDELIAALLARCTFPPAGTEVACAVSGGPDSTALLVLACRAGCSVTAIHVDHGLRPGSEQEAEVVRAHARSFGASFEARGASVQPGPNLEARARAARREALPPGTLTGHTADDQAETVVLNLLRGAGLDGLRGMRADTKPLLDLRRFETEELCAALELTVVRDPSNIDSAIRRNRIRHELVPLLDDIAERDVVPVIARQARLLGQEADLLDELCAELDPTDAVSLVAAPVALARRAIRSWLRDGSDSEAHPPDAATVDRVLAVARGELRACEVGGGRSVRRSRRKLRIEYRPIP